MPDGEWAETDERKMDSNAKIQCECTTCAHSQHVCEANVTKGEECFAAIHHHANGSVSIDRGCKVIHFHCIEFEKVTQDELENACRKRNEIMRFCCRHGRDGSGDFCNRPIALNLSRACDQTLNPFLNGTHGDDESRFSQNMNSIIVISTLSSLALLLLILLGIYWYCNYISKRSVHANSATTGGAAEAEAEMQEMSTVPSMLYSEQFNTVVRHCESSGYATERSFSWSDLSGATLSRRTIVDCVELIREIGHGRFGCVYEARCHWFGLVAVKKFKPSESESFQLERSLYGNISHPNVLRVHFADEVPISNVRSEFWLVSEYHSKGSLHKVLQENALHVRFVMRYCLSFMLGLAYLHKDLYLKLQDSEQRKPAIAHRDLKPQNILVSSQTQCVVADLGLALTNDKVRECRNSSENLRTVGTIRYMAPEVLAKTFDQLNFESYLRADIYSAAIVMFEIVNRVWEPKMIAKPDLSINCYKKFAGEGISRELMKHQVAIEKQRPTYRDDLEELRRATLESRAPVEMFCLKKLMELIDECWNEDPCARPTALRIYSRINKLLFDIGIVDSDIDRKFCD